MREQVLNDVVARRFLLGQLSPEEQGRIEELAFEDSDTFTFLESAEDDLIDDFIKDELSPDEKQRFENHFLPLVPGRREYLDTSRLMQRGFDKALSEEPVRYEPFSFIKWFHQQRPWLQISMTAATLALILIAVWLYLRAREERQPTPHQAGPDRPVAVPSPRLEVSPSLTPTTSPVHAENKPKPSARETPRDGPTYAILMPGSVRGEGPQQLQLPTDYPNLNIELPLVTRVSYARYEAVLEAEDGTVLQRWPKLRAQQLRLGKVLRIGVPGALLKPQEFYRIVVNGTLPKGQVQEIERYPFEAVK